MRDAAELTDIEPDDATVDPRAKINYDDCNVGDYVIIKGENEDGEEEDWFGQIKAKVAQNELATVKFLQKCENLEEFIDEFPDAEESDITDMYQWWQGYGTENVSPDTFKELGPNIFHRARRSGLGDTGKKRYFCRASTCMGRCNVEAGLKRKAPATATVKLEVDVDLEPKKKVSDLLLIPKDAVEWEPNVMAECRSTDVDNYPFEYATMREQAGETEKHPRDLKSACYCHGIRGLRKDHTDDVHALHGGVCPALAILRGMVIHSFYVKEVPNKGYGIFARERISKGAYLFEYVGEIITRAEASRREEQYMANGQFFLVDIQGQRNSPSYMAYTMDMTRKGNLARMLNHGCTPNVRLVEARVDEALLSGVQSKFRSASRMCCIAIEDIEVGEELCIDYVPVKKGGNMRKTVQCDCGSSDCRGWIF